MSGDKKTWGDSSISMKEGAALDSSATKEYNIFL